MITINNLKLNIEISGEGERNIILLHGWGQCTKAYYEVEKHLSKKFTVYNVDLPGFGLSERPQTVYGTKDYSDILEEIIHYFQIENPMIIGHSFGGRVAIKYASLSQSVSKIVLVDSAGIVHKKSLRFYLRVYTYKFLRKFFSLPFLKRYKNKVLKHFGSTDYKNANEMMRKILVKVVNEDLREDLKKIHCPTLLVWGTNDEVTPIEDAYIMKDCLNDAGIVKIENAGHFSYLENPNLFLSVLDSFFQDEQ